MLKEQIKVLQLPALSSVHLLVDITLTVDVSSSNSRRTNEN